MKDKLLANNTHTKAKPKRPNRYSQKILVFFRKPPEVSNAFTGLAGVVLIFVSRSFHGVLGIILFWFAVILIFIGLHFAFVRGLPRSRFKYFIVPVAALILVILYFIQPDETKYEVQITDPDICFLTDKTEKPVPDSSFHTKFFINNMGRGEKAQHTLMKALYLYLDKDIENPPSPDTVDHRIFPGLQEMEIPSRGDDFILDFYTKGKPFILSQSQIDRLDKRTAYIYFVGKFVYFSNKSKFVKPFVLQYNYEKNKIYTYGKQFEIVKLPK